MTSRQTAPVLDRVVTWTTPATSNPFDPFGGETPGTVSTIWAARSDPAPRDSVNASTGGFFGIRRRVYTVRYDHGASFGIDHKITDGGVTWTVKGRAEHPRRLSYVDLLCETADQG